MKEKGILHSDWLYQHEHSAQISMKTPRRTRSTMVLVRTDSFKHGDVRKWRETDMETRLRQNWIYS